METKIDDKVMERLDASGAERVALAQLFIGALALATTRNVLGTARAGAVVERPGLAPAAAGDEAHLRMQLAEETRGKEAALRTLKELHAVCEWEDSPTGAAMGIVDRVRRLVDIVHGARDKVWLPKRGEMVRMLRVDEHYHGMISPGDVVVVGCVGSWSVVKLGEPASVDWTADQVLCAQVRKRDDDSPCPTYWGVKLEDVERLPQTPPEAKASGAGKGGEP